MKLQSSGYSVMALLLVICAAVLALMFKQHQYIDGMGSILFILVLLFCITK